MTWRNSVNQSSGVARIGDVNDYVRVEKVLIESPIDIFYRTTQDILKVGTPALLSAHSTLGPLLLVGLVSATENYFRDVFARIIRVCPIARAAASDQDIKLGSVIWHGDGDVERGAFDHISFADAENILKYGRRFTGHTIKQPSTLEEFDRICEIRHGIVHAGAVMGGKNAIRLRLPANQGPLRIKVDFPQLQESGSVCTTLVAAVNTEFFSEIAQRWAVKWPKLPGWNVAQRHALFREVWNVFYSARDAANRSIPEPLSPVKCRNRVLSEFS
jgi:hypothetical protein